MKKKGLFILLSLFIVTALHAQKEHPKVAPVKVPVTGKNDTTIVYKGKEASKQAGKLIAGNLEHSDPDNTTTEAQIRDAAAKKYSHIPLAGEKSYFGDKNEYVNDFVRRYLELHNQTLSCVQNKSTDPFDIIDKNLEEKKMPKELKYLAVIESALNHNAVSRAGAVGPWQLMESTARMMGLKVSSRQDDRTDWNKSTNAAIKYLDILYGQMNDWLLVIAAYNSGPVTVQRAIDKTGSRNFWDIKEYLPRETQGHVLAFIATASIFENLSKFISLGSIPLDFKFSKEEEAASSVTNIKTVNTNINLNKPNTATGAANNVTPIITKTVVATTASNAKAVTATVPNNTTKTVIAPATGIAVKTPAPATIKKASTYTDEDLKNMYIIRVTEPLNFDIVAQVTGINKNLLDRWNPDYDMFIYGTYPTPYYSLHLPKDKTDVFLAKKSEIVKRSKVYYASNK